MEEELEVTAREPTSAHHQFLDHGMSLASKAAHQLALAVNSIPAYARASSLMLVLTPFIRHKVGGKLETQSPEVFVDFTNTTTTTRRTGKTYVVSRAGENGAGAGLKVCDIAMNCTLSA